MKLSDMTLTSLEAINFWKCVNIAGTDECWEWNRGKFSSGYGCFYLRGAARRAHRVSFLLENGNLHEGMEICHSCDNHSCVNPKHLFEETHHANMIDASKKKRMWCPSGEKNHNSKLTTEQVVEILHSDGKHRDIGARFGISQVHVSRIKRKECRVNG